MCRFIRAALEWVTRSDDFSRPIAVKATEVATALLGILVNLNRGKGDINVAVRAGALCQS